MVEDTSDLAYETLTTAPGAKSVEQLEGKEEKEGRASGTCVCCCTSCGRSVAVLNGTIKMTVKNRFQLVFTEECQHISKKRTDRIG